ncbi:MAG: TlpA disulfide reductase family protein [Bacteroidales bacterium]|nr:TlpA disulfide reductase family protein [Bacteroidales bacterium]
MAQEANRRFMKEGLIILFFILFFGFRATADQPEGYRIEIKCPQLPEKRIILSECIGGKLFPVDTLTTNKRGVGLFEGEKSLKDRFCFIKLTPSLSYDVLVGQEQILTISMSDTSRLDNTRIKGARESSLFASFKTLLSKQKEKKESLTKELTITRDKKKRERLIRKVKDTDQKMLSAMNKLINENRGSFLATFIQAIIAPSNSEPEAYFAAIDLSDERLWNTFFVPQKVNRWLKMELGSKPEAFEQKCTWLIDRAKGNKLCERYLIEKIFVFAEESPLIEMENLRYNLEEKYVAQLKEIFPFEPFVLRMEEEKDRIRSCRIGQIAKPLRLYDFNDNPIQTDTIKASHTVLFFYEPDCAHCHESAPILYKEGFEQFQQAGLQVVAICLSDLKEEWEAFINQHDCHKWINVWDPERTSYFWEYYDISRTPAIYLLDSKGTIIAKKIEVQALIKLLTNIYSKN